MSRSFYGINYPKMDSASRVYLAEAKRQNLPPQMAEAHTYIGTANLESGELGEALIHFTRAHAISDSLGSGYNKAVAINNIGATLHKMDQLPQALTYYRQAIAGFKAHNKPARLGQPLYNIAIIFQDLGQRDSAIVYYQEAIQVAEEQQDTLSLSDLYNGMSNLSFEIGAEEEGRLYMQKALLIGHSIGDFSRMFYPVLNQGTQALKAKKLKAAREYLFEACDIAYAMEAIEMQIDVEKALAILDSTEKNPEQAYLHLANWSQLTARKTQEERNKKIQELQALFEHEQQSKEILIQNTLLKQQRTNIFILLGILAFMVILVLALTRVSEIRKRHSFMMLKMNEEKDAMLHAVAHDLQSPVVNIRGLVNLLAESANIDPSEKLMLHMIDGELDRSDHLVHNLLDLESIESGDLEVHLMPVNLPEIATQISEKYRQVAHKKRILIETVWPKEPILLQTDPSFLHRILENLVSNAVKFSPSGTMVKIDMNLESNQIRINVTDQGPGITEKDRSKIFGRFQRLSAQPTGGEMSTGLGLAVTKALVDRLKGRIEVLSTPGSGAVFSVLLPC
ncbi:MAG: tetratricopeptide repeat-containing sensor histidine kinase [Bacteroidia bacterium]|nr:tetratricopeptide repeat-containing sensor histidine kinase [Bacteroidia bacterium]